jgi:hypothetical protein
MSCGFSASFHATRTAPEGNLRDAYLGFVRFNFFPRGSNMQRAQRNPDAAGTARGRCGVVCNTLRVFNVTHALGYTVLHARLDGCDSLRALRGSLRYRRSSVKSRS